MGKWTPGRWIAHWEGPVRRQALSHRLRTEDSIPIADVYGGDANANLIAAAPELYDALDRAKRLLEEYAPGCPKTEIASLGEALAKARGE